MAYVNQIEEEDFLVLSFSNVLNFLDCDSKEQIEVLLISEELMLELEGKNLERNTMQIILLCEGGNISQEEKYPSIYKFQSVLEILKEVRKIYRPQKRVSNLNIQKSEVRKNIIAVYAAAGGSKKTCFSLGMAQIIGAQRKCLYLNFDFFGGILEKKDELQKGMSEFIYYLKQTEENPFKKSVQARRSQYGFDYYLSSAHPFDLLELEVLDCEYLLHSMREESDYDDMILDIGIWNSSMVSLLMGCDILYYPLNRGKVGEKKFKEFCDFLKLEGKETILEKMITVKIPEDERIQGDFEISDLAKGTMGNYIRSVLLDRKES